MLSGWGRLKKPGKEVYSEDLKLLSHDATLFRGLGRSYGDSAIPPPGQLEVASTKLANRILSFEPTTGLLKAEAGLSLRELNRTFLPRCQFPPVTPGTQFVTLGGMVAADVHGKNHHIDGTFGKHVKNLLIRVSDGRQIKCSPIQEPDLFWATVGGMGLTGHILEVEFQMRKIPTPWIYSEHVKCKDFATLTATLSESAQTWPFTVGWLDCLGSGRGILIRGRWAEPNEVRNMSAVRGRQFSVPFELPNWVLNRWTMLAFNRAVYRMQSNSKTILHPETFFYPLDNLRHWNRIYGRRGFIQYQCVLPNEESAAEFLRYVREKQILVFLCVVKDCGDEGQGMLSFPLPGISIALDVPVDRNTQTTVDDLNEMVSAKGGRIYLAKDAFTRNKHFRRMEPRLDKWMHIRKKWDPKMRFRSAQSVRVFGDPI